MNKTKILLQVMRFQKLFAKGKLRMYKEEVCKYLQHCMGYKEANSLGNDFSLIFHTVDFVSLKL